MRYAVAARSVVRTKRNIIMFEAAIPPTLAAALTVIASSQPDFFMSRCVPRCLRNCYGNRRGGVRHQHRINRHPDGQSTAKNARGTHPGIADEVAAASSIRRAVGFCVGSSRTSREAVARASTRACGHSGIWAMLCTRQSIIAAFGNWAHLAASAQGSCPSRARIDRIVSCEPFSSVPTSAKRNVFRPEFFNAKASG